jgi:hypothetical protein
MAPTHRKKLIPKLVHTRTQVSATLGSPDRPDAGAYDADLSHILPLTAKLPHAYTEASENLRQSCLSSRASVSEPLFPLVKRPRMRSRRVFESDSIVKVCAEVDAYNDYQR